jgi:hypothetical protein
VRAGWGFGPGVRSGLAHPADAPDLSHDYGANPPFTGWAGLALMLTP